MVPKGVIGTGVLLEVFMVEMLSERTLKRASVDADREKMGLCGAVVSSFSWISGLTP